MDTGRDISDDYKALATPNREAHLAAAALPGDMQNSAFPDGVLTVPDKSNGIHAHVIGCSMASEVTKVRQLLLSLSLFGAAEYAHTRTGSELPHTYPTTAREALALTHEQVVQSIESIIPRSSASSWLFTRIDGDPPFVLQLLCGALSKNELSPREQDSLSSFADRLSELASRYTTFATSPDLFSAFDLPHSRDVEFSQLRQDHRDLFFDISAFLESRNWFSPSQFSSMQARKGLHQPASSSGSDYGRSVPELLILLERRLQHEAALPTDRSRLLLTGGGLQALNTALGVVENIAKHAEGAGHSRPVLAQPGIYWESDARARNLSSSTWVSAVTIDGAASAEKLAERILAEKPRLVLTAPIGNSPDMPSMDIRRLLEIVSTPAFQVSWHGIDGKQHPGELVIVVDNTMLGHRAQWKQFDWSRLPPWCIVGSVESLIKQGQDGFDYAPCGSLTWYASPKVTEWLSTESEIVRARAGNTPPPSTLFKMMLSSSADYLALRSGQTRFNVRFLAAELHFSGAPGRRRDPGEPPALPLQTITSGKIVPRWDATSQQLEDRDPPVLYLKMPEETSAAWSEYLRTLVGQKLDVPATEHFILSLFISSVLDGAKTAGINICEGTSFGFDETRISLINYYDTPDSMRCAVRIAPGIEHIDKIKKTRKYPY